MHAELNPLILSLNVNHVKRECSHRIQVHVRNVHWTVILLLEHVHVRDVLPDLNQTPINPDVIHVHPARFPSMANHVDHVHSELELQHLAQQNVTDADVVTNLTQANVLRAYLAHSPPI